MERNERVWIIFWAALLGFSLLMLHNWVESLPKPGERFGLIWPLYEISISLPLTLQVLSRYRTQKALWVMAIGFSLIMAGSTSYVGHVSWISDLPNSDYLSQLFLTPNIVFVCWFVLMPFAEHRLIKSSWFDDYSLLFSAAWRNTVKLLSAATFTGIFWGLLFLWAGLFKILKVGFFYDLFTSRNFVYPITAIAYGVGLSLYSAKEDALVGLYRASLNVLAWLLPLVTFIMLFFLLALPLQGLGLLWKTGYATTLMITLLSGMIFLFNAAWQDAIESLKFPKWLLKLISVGLVSMPVYIALCTYSLGLRIAQHGWSIDRIWAALIVFVLSIYSFGYTATILRKQTSWMNGAKRINIFASLIIVALLTLTCTPILDPARISVDSQIGRLMDNKITADVFDYDYLRFRSGKYGNDELKKMLNITNHPQEVLIHEKAASALLKQNSYLGMQDTPELSHESLAGKFKLYPKGMAIDPSFVDYIGGLLKNHQLSLNCLNSNQPCQVLAIDLNADGQDELVLFDSYQSKVYGRNNNNWQQVGYLNGPSIYGTNASSLSESLEKMDVEAIPRKLLDVRIGRDKYSVNEVNMK